MSQQVKVYRELDLQNLAKITGRQVISKTGDYAVSVNDSGKLIIANKAGTAVAFTLPAVASSKGRTYYFAVLGSGGMTINGPAGTNVIVGKNNAAANTVAFTTASEMIGAACRFWGDGTYYYFMQLSDCTATLA